MLLDSKSRNSEIRMYKEKLYADTINIADRNMDGRVSADEWENVYRIVRKKFNTESYNPLKEFSEFEFELYLGIMKRYSA